MLAPIALRPDNFTPPSRTPWGGTRLLSRYKACVTAHPPIVGESWEISVEPSFPSLTREGARLDACIAQDPVGWLGREGAARFGGQTPLLVKLLDAADNLSVQVHPADDDPALAGDESGKPEAWVVLDAEPGAGLYLGFRDGVSRGDVARALAANAKLDAMMNFVPVGAGDAFVIDAGTPHAIGAGVTLLEPQFVRPGRRGLTYRYWDWDRRYDEAGRLDPAGAPRELHVARSLDVTRWDRGGGAAFVAGCRATADVLVRGAATRTRVVRWRWFEVERWSGTGRLRIDATSRLWALTSVGGSVRVSTSGSELSLACGESGVVPAALGDLVVDLAAGDVFAVTT